MLMTHCLSWKKNRLMRSSNFLTIYYSTYLNLTDIEFFRNTPSHPCVLSSSWRDKGNELFSVSWMMYTEMVFFSKWKITLKRCEYSQLCRYSKLYPGSAFAYVCVLAWVNSMHFVIRNEFGKVILNLLIYSFWLLV